MRRWNVTKLGDGCYTGTCADVVGHASGHLEGNMLSWRYKLTPAFGRKVSVTFNDVMVLQEAGILINRAVVSKWGIKLGEVLISFRQQSSLFLHENSHELAYQRSDEW